MKKPSTDDDDEIRPLYRTGLGDIGVVIIAAGCTLAFLLMMVLPSPIAKYERAKQTEVQRQRQEPVDKAVSSGEVSVSIAPIRH